MNCASPSETRNESPVIHAVRNWPDEPIADAWYVFDNLARRDVTRHNHGLHKYPAKFIPQIPQWGLRYRRDLDSEMILDPFCGSGTTLVEARLMGDRAIGYDISPLAVTITRAKAGSIALDPSLPDDIGRAVVERAGKHVQAILDSLVPGQNSLGMHFTWSNWFRREEIARLIAIRYGIGEVAESHDGALANFLLACLSSVAKSSSYLNEDQIKVRFDKSKPIQDPFESFPSFVGPAIRAQQEYTRVVESNSSVAEADVASAVRLPLADSSVDRIVTSPPYINAVDYTMAHKYNLFLLGLVAPESFKDHCREYIGLTERAVRVKDLQEVPRLGVPPVDSMISRIKDLHTPTGQNRAYVVGQYFSGMYASLRECNRVLRDSGRAMIVIGNSNRICGIDVPTADLFEALAYEAGLCTELRFYHLLANRSSMRLNRSSTGGTVHLEAVYALRKRK